MHIECSGDASGNTAYSGVELMQASEDYRGKNPYGVYVDMTRR